MTTYIIGHHVLTSLGWGVVVSVGPYRDNLVIVGVKLDNPELWAFSKTEPNNHPFFIVDKMTHNLKDYVYIPSPEPKHDTL